MEMENVCLLINQVTCLIKTKIAKWFTNEQIKRQLVRVNKELGRNEIAAVPAAGYFACHFLIIFKFLQQKMWQINADSCLVQMSARQISRNFENEHVPW